MKQSVDTRVKRALRSLLRRIEEGRVEVGFDFDETAHATNFDVGPRHKLFAFTYKPLRK